MVLTEQQTKTLELLNPWQSGKQIELGIPRTKYLQEISQVMQARKQILFILGSRRVGKTVTIFQYIYQLISSGINPNQILFLSLDNTNLAGLDLFSLLTESNYQYIFLDEIHYFPNWAQVLKSLYDLPSFSGRIICSGSSSKLIEDNKAFLTGRNTTITMYPLSFLEFMEFTTEKNKLNDYLYYGGYPEYVIERQPNYLNDLVRDIIEKDIAKLHNIRDYKALFAIGNILAKQIGYKGSPNKIANVLGLDNKTVSNYLQYLHEVNLIETVSQYSSSLNKRLYAPKKYYFRDLGMRNSFVGFSDIGALVENAVFIKLAELFGQQNISYLADTSANEIDFVVSINPQMVALIEVKYNNLTSSVLSSLNKIFLKDLYEHQVQQRIVITDGVNTEVDLSNTKLKLISLLEFLEVESPAKFITNWSVIQLPEIALSYILNHLELPHKGFNLLA